MSGRRWTEDELALLEDGFHRRRVTSIAKELGRSAAAVYRRAELLGIPRREPGVMSLNELATLLGADRRLLRRCLLAGELRSTFASGRGRYGEFAIREADLIAFLRERPWIVDRERVDPTYRSYVAERYITLAEAFRRGAGHVVSLGHAAYVGLVPGQRKRGLFYVVPESTLPALIEARRMTTTDEEHRRQLVRYERTTRINEAKRRPLRRAA